MRLKHLPLLWISHDNLCLNFRIRKLNLKLYSDVNLSEGSAAMTVFYKELPASHSPTQNRSFSNHDWLMKYKLCSDWLTVTMTYYGQFDWLTQTHATL